MSNLKETSSPNIPIYYNNYTFKTKWYQNDIMPNCVYIIEFSLNQIEYINKITGAQQKIWLYRDIHLVIHDIKVIFHVIV